MTDDRLDLCPMCHGSGSCTLGPPNGEYYLRVVLDRPVAYDWVVFRTGVKEELLPLQDNNPVLTAMIEVNRLAASGYEVTGFLEGERYSTWLLQWRWR